MENQSNKLVAIFIAIIAVVIVSGVVFYIFKKPSSNTTAIPGSATTGENQPAVVTEKAPLPTIQGGTRETITQNIPTVQVTKDSSPAAIAAVPKNVAVPEAIVSTGKESSSRVFEIRAQGGTYIPNIIAVNEGDLVSVAVTAVDADYDIFFPDFGILKKVAKGATGQVQFQAASFGQYTFSCRSCATKTEGTLVVNKK